MSTQYDAIGAVYEEMKKMPAAVLEAQNIKAAIAPYAPGAKVLDLACGTGAYSRVLLEMGASHVVGVDISPVMIQAARDTSPETERLSYDVGDASDLGVIEGGDFDLVLGIWLLNYAADRAAMTKMWRTTFLNLKPGGRFVGIMPHPTDDPRVFVERMAEVRPVQYGNITPTVTGEVEDGVTIRVVAVTGVGNVEFDNFYLRKGVYEGSAREGGMVGALVWMEVVIPEGEEWRSYREVPHFGVLEVVKT